MLFYISFDIYPTGHHSFLLILVFLCDHFLRSGELPLIFSCNVAWMFAVCLPGNAFVSPLTFKGIFYEYRYLGCQFVYAHVCTCRHVWMCVCMYGRVGVYVMCMRMCVFVWVNVWIPFSSWNMSFHCLCLCTTVFSGLYDFLVSSLGFHWVGLMSFNHPWNPHLPSLPTILLCPSFSFQAATARISDHLKLCHTTLILTFFFFSSMLYFG